MVSLTIENHNQLLNFVKRKDVSPGDAITVFRSAFKVVAVVFICAISKEPNFVKEEVIEKIERFINDYKDGIYKKVVIF